MFPAVPWHQAAKYLRAKAENRPSKRYLFPTWLWTMDIKKCADLKH